MDWNILTSRRFCAVCSIENRRHDLAPQIAVGAGALALVFGFGSLWGGSGGDFQGSSSLPATLKSNYSSQDPRESASADRPAPPAPIQGEVPPTAKPGSAEVTSSDRKAGEAKYFCGALTRKGAPCSRKVKARGIRCFQHEGRPEAQPINQADGVK